MGFMLNILSMNGPALLKLSCYISNKASKTPTGERKPSLSMAACVRDIGRKRN